MAFPFKIGDVVYLKSGGTSMTVSGTSEALETVDLVWFDEHENLQRASLSIEVLELSLDQNEVGEEDGVDPEDVE